MLAQRAKYRQAQSMPTRPSSQSMPVRRANHTLETRKHLPIYMPGGGVSAPSYHPVSIWLISGSFRTASGNWLMRKHNNSGGVSSANALESAGRMTERSHWPRQMQNGA